MYYSENVSTAIENNKNFLCFKITSEAIEGMVTGKIFKTLCLSVLTFSKAKFLIDVIRKLYSFQRSIMQLLAQLRRMHK